MSNEIISRSRRDYTMKFVLFIAAILTASSLHAQTGIDTACAVSIGGIEQFITIKGKNRSLPLFLFLHGGPGGSVMGYADRFTDKLEEHFVVVQWDQRGTGETKMLNESPVPLSFAVFKTDTHELIEYLLKRFQRPKLYLAGHSWGTALGFHIAQYYPDRLYAYLAIGPMINQLESERIALDLMKKGAKKTGDQHELQALSRIHIPFENGKQLHLHRQGLLALSGSRRKLSESYVDDWAKRWLSVFNEASKVNLIESLPEIACPVYFFAGRQDLQTNAYIAETYYKFLKAPRKDFFWFDDAGHAVPTAEPDLLQQRIIEKVLPATFMIQKPGAVIGQSVEP